MPRPINTKSKLGAARKKAGISAVNLMSMSGVGLSTIQKIEAGKFPLSMRTASKLAKHLSCRPTDLVEPSVARAFFKEVRQALNFE